MSATRLTFPFVVLILLMVAFVNLQAQDAEEYLAKADSAYNALDNRAALELYAKALEADPENYEAAWKLSRAYVDVGETFKDKEKRKEAFQRSEKYARQAIEIDSTKSKGHLSLSIALGRVALDAGKKEQVRLSKEVKAELDKALAIDPDDDIALHVLGRWHRKMATLSWIQKLAANTFLGGVPKEASVEKAAECFRKAIEINPAHINHHLELAKTYEELDKKDLAVAEYEKVLELPKNDADDDEYKTYAQDRLKDLK